MRSPISTRALGAILPARVTFPAQIMHQRCLASSKRTFTTRRGTSTAQGGPLGCTSSRSRSSMSVRQSPMWTMAECRALERYMRCWAAQHVQSAGTMTMLRASGSLILRHHPRSTPLFIASLLWFPSSAALHHPCSHLFRFDSTAESTAVVWFGHVLGGGIRQVRCRPQAQEQRRQDRR